MQYILLNKSSGIVRNILTHFNILHNEFITDFLHINIDALSIKKRHSIIETLKL